MKRGVIILFTFYFYLVSTGVVLGTHYCGKSVSHTLWGMSMDSQGCKCSPKAAKKTGCCKQEHDWLKANTDDSRTITFDFQLKKLELQLFATIAYSFVGHHAVEQKRTSLAVSHPPPPPCAIPLFIRNRSILI
jgi:hypothetical protein